MSTKKVTLFEISEEQQEIINAVQEFDGEITPEIEEALIINEKNRNQKVMAYVNVFQRSDALISQAKEMKKKCDLIIKREERKQNHMKFGLVSFIQKFGEFTIGLLTFKLKKSTVVVTEVEAEALPEKYRNVKVATTINKTELKKDLIEGVVIDGAKLQVNQNLNIK